MNTTFVYTFEIIGLIATFCFAVYLLCLAREAFKSWQLMSNRVHRDLNDHADILRNYQKRIEFLEGCERQRVDAENKASAIRKQQ